MEKGHWYTDKQGNHYFVKEGETPKEGWEASKRRKMINKGKYQTSEDGKEYKDVSREEYEKYEADAEDFDLNNENDFGFDEDNKPSIDYDEIERRKQNQEEKDEMGVYLDKQMNPKDADKLRKMNNKIINDKKGLSLEDAIKSADDDVLNSQFGKDTSERKLAGAIKNEPQSAEDKYADYKEKGKSTWNQKLSRGDKVTFKDRDGNEIEGFINGFYESGELQDEDTYEEGKDNLWHDFRGVNIVDTTGRDMGNINAFQILKHEPQGISPEFDNEISKAFGYLGGNGRPNRKDGYDYIAEEFDYDNKVYHNLDEHAKYLEDRIKDLNASPFAKENPAWAAERKKDYQSQLDFIRKNKNRLQKYVDDSNATHRSRVTTRALNAIRNIDDLKRQYKNGSLSIEDIKSFLDRE